MAETGAQGGVRVHVVGTTDVGRVREHNEDAFLVLDRDAGRPLAAGESFEGRLRTALVMLVCDGMGGAAAGEVASRMAVQRVAETLQAADLAASTPDQVAALMDQALQRANSEILAKSQSSPEMKGMGTTVTAAVATPGRLFVSQVGDSRAYLLRKGLLNQITKDQSLIGQLIEEGTLTEEEAEKLGGRNIVLQAVGVEDTLRVDTKSWPLLRGDVVLLCSDGLSGMVKDARMVEILKEAGNDLHAAADRLVAEANANGGRDNVTVVLGRFDGDGLRAPMETDDAGAIETAGAAFRAPPPPEVPNPMRKIAAWGVVLLALIVAAFVQFRPSKARLSLPVRPVGAQVRLFDGQGREIASVDAGAEPVVFSELEPGDYKVRVSSPRHFEQTVDLPAVEQGVADLPEVFLVPKPGSIEVTSSDPDVTVRIHLDPVHPLSEPLKGEEYSLGESAGAVRKIENAPAGSFRIEASRPGFAEWTAAGTLDPEEQESVVVPPLQERKGTLTIQGCAGGHVEIRSARNSELLGGGDATGDTWTAQVRAVRAHVVVSWKGYRTWEGDVDVAPDAETPLEVRREADKVRVTFRGPADQIVKVRRLDEDARDEETPIQGDGISWSINLLPGRYRAETGDGKWAREFGVEPGAAPAEIRLEAR